ncbi:MAG: DUF4411 family protein [Pseudonocardia sp.]
MTQPLYSFDTSALIKGRRDLLLPDVFPTFWANIEQSIQLGHVRAVDEVDIELSKRDDETRAWAKSQSDLFVPLDEDIQAGTMRVLASHPKLAAGGGSRNRADAFVIGFAHAREGVVVTEETMSNRLEKPRIPDACRALGIRCLTLVQFAQEQGWQF